MEKTTWLCLQTYTKRESALASSLTSLGISAYAPCYSNSIKEGRRSYDRTQPLFPSYLFASHDYFDRFDSVRRLPLRLRSFVVGEVEYGLIEEIRDREEAGLVKLASRPCPFDKDDVVRINIGTMTGVVGIFDEALSDNERCVILINMFQRQVPVVKFISELSLVVGEAA